MMHKTTALLVAGAFAGSAALTATPALAVEAGDWFGRVGASHVNPKDDNAFVSGTGTLEVDSDTHLSFTIGYMVTDNWAVEVLGALPFEHDINLVGTGKVGSTKHLPPVVSAQYHFQPRASVRPYVGVGLNYTAIFDTETTGALAGSSLDLDNSWGLAGQVGADFDLGTGHWFGNVDLRYIDIDSDASSSAVGDFEVEIDPWVFSVGIGTTF